MAAARRQRCWLACVALVGGCAGALPAGALGALRGLAARDLACPEEEVRLTGAALDGSIQRAQGCGRSSVYAWQQQRWEREPAPEAADTLRSWSDRRWRAARCEEARYVGNADARPLPVDCERQPGPEEPASP